MTAVEFQKALGKRVKTLREKRKLTQAEVAKRAAMDRTEVCKLEAGTHNPQLQTLRRVARALEVSLSKLFEPLK
jgi:transcriptional regulator with XRE-family HTH domain